MSYTPQQRAFERGVDIVVATPGRLIDLMDAGRGRPRPGRDAPCWTRPTTWPTSASCPRSPSSSTPSRPAVSGCCSPRRWTRRSTSSSARYLSDPVTALGRRRHRQRDHDGSPGRARSRRRTRSRVTAGARRAAGRTVLFVRTQRAPIGWPSSCATPGFWPGRCTAGSPQGARTRILAAFSDGSLPILVATDVAARGIHVDDVGLVLQVDPPHGQQGVPAPGRSDRPRRRARARSSPWCCRTSGARCVGCSSRRRRTRGGLGGAGRLARLHNGESGRRPTRSASSGLRSG